MLTSKRPYLVRAIHEWIADNDLTPYLLVDASFDGVCVPDHAVQNDRVVLNMGIQAVDMLQLGNQHITFDARFNGCVENIAVPLEAVLAIYARENGVGMSFSQENDGLNASAESVEPILAASSEPNADDAAAAKASTSAGGKPASSKSGLRLVK